MLIPEIEMVREVLDPVAPSMFFNLQLAARSKTLTGRTVGLFWNRKPNGDLFLLRIGELLKDRFKDINVKFLTGKSNPASGAPAESIKEALKCNSAILMTAD